MRARTNPQRLLVSVPHTGTRFYEAIVQPDRTRHLTAPEALDMARKAKVIMCTVRRPEDTWASWWNRGDRANPSKTGPAKNWYIAWKCFAALADKKVFYLPIDHPSREERLQALADHMGRPFYPEWDKKVGAKTYTDEKGILPKVDMSELYQIPIIAELYG